MEWSTMPELKEVIVMLKKAFPTELGHIQPDRILYAAFSKKKSTTLARAVSIQPRYAIFLDDVEYVIEIHKENWIEADEGKRLYVVLHELKHIPTGGFDPESKQYKRIVKHNVEDFIELRERYGINLENTNELIKKVRV